MRVVQRGWTALMIAADKGRTATAAELVRLGADINAKSNVRTGSPWPRPARAPQLSG